MKSRYLSMHFPVIKGLVMDFTRPSGPVSQRSTIPSHRKVQRHLSRLCPAEFPKRGASSRVNCLPDGKSCFLEECSRAVDVAKAEHRLGDSRCFVCDWDITSQQHAPKHRKRRTKGSNPHGHFSPFQVRIQANHSSSPVQPHKRASLGGKVLVVVVPLDQSEYNCNFPQLQASSQQIAPTNQIKSHPPPAGTASLAPQIPATHNATSTNGAQTHHIPRTPFARNRRNEK